VNELECVLSARSLETGIADPAALLEPSGPEASSSDPIFVEVLTRSGRAEAVALLLRPSTVDIWFRGHCCGVFSRVEMRSWLAGAGRRLAAGEVTLSLDPRSDGERVVISLDDVIAWTISPAELAIVRERV
jgi:hypothetical protein